MSAHALCSLNVSVCNSSPLSVSDACGARRHHSTPPCTCVVSQSIRRATRLRAGIAPADETTSATAGAHVTPAGAPPASTPSPPAIPPTSPTTTAAAAVVDGDAACEMEQSPLDDRRFRRVTLPNGLRVLLVEDATSEKAAACLSVAVGSCSNPPELPGLAHFCEHMVFLGSEKYPVEGTFRAFVESHGGSYNAFTAEEHTAFYLSVMVDKGGSKSGEDETKQAAAAEQSAIVSEGPHAAAPAADAPTVEPPTLDIPSSVPPGLAPYYEALDRCAQFFISPLFTPSATAREVQAVNSEFNDALLKDSWRIQRMIKLAAAPDHPFHRWGFGNAASLWDRPTAEGIDVRAALLAFHGRHYSANQMTLALVAPASLDDLAAWADTLFGAVPNTGAPLAADTYAGVVPFGPAETARLFHIVPVEELRQVQLWWAVPPFGDTYRTNPVGFLADRIEYAGPDSLLSAFKKRGWASEVWAYEYMQMTHGGLLKVHITLTLAGAAKMDAVVGAVFAYIRLISERGITRRAYADVAARARLSWTYKERQEPCSAAVRAALAMHTLPDAHLLTGEHLYEVYDEELIRSVAAALTPTAAVIFYVDPAFVEVADKADEWHGTRYTEQAVPNTTLAVWTDAKAWPELAVAPPNAFIATDLTLVCDTINGTSDATGAASGASSPPKAAVEQPTVEETQVETVAGPPANSRVGRDGDSIVPRAHDTGPDVVAKVVDAAFIAPLSPETEGHAPPPYRPFPLLATPVLPAAAIESVHPVVLRDDASVRLHYKLDHTFRRPQAHVNINVVTPALSASPRSKVLASLVCGMLCDELTEETHDATDSGLSYSIDAYCDGFWLAVDGFSHKLPLLLQQVVDGLVGLRADPDRFARVLEVLHRQFKNEVKRQPVSHARTVSWTLLLPHRWQTTELLRCCGDGPGASPFEGGPERRRARVGPSPRRQRNWMPSWPPSGSAAFSSKRSSRVTWHPLPHLP
eukprot:TRINITY_DN899_c0_g1_i4.p1 TRINITY_DN899_c0_g1~~TRINITY_DN899_c0_g1_i4.p1  ORF type:complete len:976 (-),score=175.50 TRINITY_DN899_c0_g1_i4:924-3851(-)